MNNRKANIRQYLKDDIEAHGLRRSDLYECRLAKGVCIDTGEEVMGKIKRLENGLFVISCEDKDTMHYYRIDPLSIRTLSHFDLKGTPSFRVGFADFKEGTDRYRKCISFKDPKLHFLLMLIIPMIIIATSSLSTISFLKEAYIAGVILASIATIGVIIESFLCFKIHQFEKQIFNPYAKTIGVRRAHGLLSRLLWNILKIRMCEISIDGVDHLITSFSRSEIKMNDMIRWLPMNDRIWICESI